MTTTPVGGTPSSGGVDPLKYAQGLEQTTTTTTVNPKPLAEPKLPEKGVDEAAEQVSAEQKAVAARRALKQKGNLV